MAPEEGTTATGILLFPSEIGFVKGTSLILGRMAALHKIKKIPSAAKQLKLFRGERCSRDSGPCHRSLTCNLRAGLRRQLLACSLRGRPLAQLHRRLTGGCSSLWCIKRSTELLRHSAGSRAWYVACCHLSLTSCQIRSAPVVHTNIPTDS